MLLDKMPLLFCLKQTFPNALTVICLAHSIPIPLITWQLISGLQQ